MGYFVTGDTLYKDTTHPGVKDTLNNQLYCDDNGELYLTPRKQWTDGYTIPRFIAWIAGGRFEQVIKPARGHDLECATHQVIIVKISLYNLRRLGYLYDFCGNTYCLDIPKEFLSIRPTGFFETNARFKRMLKAIKLPKWKIGLYYLGVNLNLGWLRDKIFGKVKQIDINKIYDGGVDQWART